MYLEKYTSFKSELAVAETLEDLKPLQNKSDVFAEILKIGNAAFEVQFEFGVFRIEIEAKKGAWLEKMFPAGGNRGNQYKRVAKSELPNLADEDISPDESSNARLIAEEDELVKEVIKELFEEGQVVTPSLVSTRTRKKKKKNKVEKRVQEYKEETKDLTDFNIDIYNTKKKFNIIYADPAWRYWEGGEKNQSLHYNTMTVEEIKNLPVKNIADKNCILFLWVTFPILKEAFDIIEAWGFKYSTCGFVWVKKNKKADSYFFGNGSWTRANAELCLIAIKGTVTRIDASISQIIDDPVSKHSEKPERVRNLITSLVGELPRIELFSRNKNKDGWVNWGNQI